MGLRYKDIVDYDKLDPFKEAALARFRKTLTGPERHGIHLLEESVGETAAVLDCGPFYLAFGVEGLGTKNLIAEAMAEKERIGSGIGLERRKLFAGIGIDGMAMSLNDLGTCGAAPLVFEPIVASGDSAYFDDTERYEGLLDGFEKGALFAGAAIPGGETPTLKGIVHPHTLDIAGASLGIIKPKSRLVLGQRLEPGLTIYGIASTGIHANGVSLARQIAERLPDGYFTQLPNGKTIGEALLAPTAIYTRLIERLFEAGVDVRYLQPVTGHGWAKFMRKQQDLRYVIEQLPAPHPEFEALCEAGPVDRAEAYNVWNMGIGLAVFAPAADARRIRLACIQERLAAVELGKAEAGPREVYLAPLDVTYRPR